MIKPGLIFSIFSSGQELKKLRKQFAELADKVQTLQSRLDETRQELCNNTNIEHVYVERIHVDRLEFSNNFGAMGIRELNGTLNIGVNCPPPPPKAKRESKEPPSKRTPGSNTADPRPEQGNQKWPFSNNTHVKQKNCPDGPRYSPGLNKEAPPKREEPKHKKDINQAVKFPEKQMGPVCNINYGV